MVDTSDTSGQTEPRRQQEGDERVARALSEENAGYEACFTAVTSRADEARRIAQERVAS